MKRREALLARQEKRRPAVLNYELAFEVAEFFQLSKQEAKVIHQEVIRSVQRWQDIATESKISRGEQQKKEIRALLRDPDITVNEVAKRYGVSRATLYRHVGPVAPSRY